MGITGRGSGRGEAGRPGRGIKAVLVAAAMLLTACGTQAGQAASANGGTVKVAGVASGPFTQTFNPLLVDSGNAVGYATQAIYEPLLQDDFAKGVNRPWLVTSYSFGSQGKSLILNLRQHVTWSDGQPFTADDVAFTFELIRKYAAFNSNGLALAGARALSPDQAEIDFSQPAYQVLWWRTTVVAKHVWQGIQDPVKYSDNDPVGTGPFTLQSFTPQVITLKKNPRYWQAGLPRVQTVQYLAFDSDSSMVAALEAGQVDWIGARVDPGPVTKHDPAHIGSWVTKPTASVVVMLPNNQVYPLSIPAVRRAISQAIDRRQVTKVGMGNQNEPALSPTGLDVDTRASVLAPQYRDVRYGSGDPAAARQTLSQAGFKMGPDHVFRTPTGSPLSLELLLPSSSPYGDFVGASQVMVRQLLAAGIKLAVKTESQVSWRSDTGLGSFQLTMRPLGGTNDVYDLFDRIFSQDTTAPVGKNAQRNYERYQNAAVGTVLHTYASSAPGSAAEKQALAELQRLMVEDVPVIPLFFTSGIGLWRTDHATGFPSRSDPYAVSIPDSPNSEMVLMRLRPAGK